MTPIFKNQAGRSGDSRSAVPRDGLMFTYQGLGGREGLQVFRFGQLRNQILWVHVDL